MIISNSRGIKIIIKELKLKSTHFIDNKNVFKSIIIFIIFLSLIILTLYYFYLSIVKKI